MLVDLHVLNGGKNMTRYLYLSYLLFISIFAIYNIMFCKLWVIIE